MSTLRRITAVAVLLTTALLAATPAAHAAKAENDIYRQLDLLANVFERVRANYVDPVSDSKLIEYAISGMLTSLDPHSSYMPPKSFDKMREQTRGEFGGLGIEVTMDKGVIKVISPIEDTPAARAGIQSGDLIIQIDGEDVQGLSLNDAVDKMRGKVGTKIRLKVFRESEKKSFDVTIVRDRIKIRSVRWELEKDGIGYVRITTFNEQVEDLLPTALKELKEKNGGKPLTGLVLDLRNNPGGLLNEAIFVADEFLNEGEIVSTRGRIRGQNQRYHAEPGDALNGAPMAVLINGGSASASEIVAGALQDHKRAVIMGTRSFGKGSVQTIINLPENAGMRLTTALYYTPSGRSIQAKGIEPDVEVPLIRVAEVLDDNIHTTEASLRGHIEVDKKGREIDHSDGYDNKEKSDKTTKAKDAGADGDDADKADKPFDYQLDRALGVVKALALMSGGTTK